MLFNANYGQHMAIVAGFERCRGERVVTLDADLQNPPEEIGKLLAAMDAGTRLRRRRAAHARGFVVAPLRVAGDEPAARAHHAHPDDRPGLHAARVQPRDRRRGRGEPRGQHVHSGARLHVCARSPTEVDVAHEERAAGESKYSLYKLIRLNFDLITGFSLVPLQLFSMFGMLVSVLALADLRRRHRVPARLFDWQERIGRMRRRFWDRDILAFFLIGMLLFGLGLIGEYVGRIYQQVRDAAALHGPRGARTRCRQAGRALERRRVAHDCAPSSSRYHNVGVRCLQVLLAHGVDVPLVVTHDDDPRETDLVRLGRRDRRRHAACRRSRPPIRTRRTSPRRVAALAPDFLFSFYYRTMLKAPLLRGRAARRAQHARLAAAEITADARRSTGRCCTASARPAPRCTT